MGETISARFTNEGVPYTGLSPVLYGYDRDGNTVLNGVAMSEVGGGFYIYDWEAYQDDRDYFFYADAGVAVDNAYRYAYGWNEVIRASHKVSANFNLLGQSIPHLPEGLAQEQTLNRIIEWLKTELANLQQTVKAMPSPASPESIRDAVSQLTGMISQVSKQMADNAQSEPFLPDNLARSGEYEVSISRLENLVKALDSRLASVYNTASSYKDGMTQMRVALAETRQEIKNAELALEQATKDMALDALVRALAERLRNEEIGLQAIVEAIINRLQSGNQSDTRRKLRG